MNDMTNPAGVPAEQTVDYGAFDDFAAELAPGEPIVAFKNQKWRWRTSEERVLNKKGQPVAANLFETQRGWIRFEEVEDPKTKKKVTVVAERRLGKVANRFQPASREELGYHDQSKWKVGEDGPIDPWVAIIQFPAVLIGEKGNYQVMMTGNSGGWRRAVGDLMKEWAGQRALNHGKVPVVALGINPDVRTSRGTRDFPTMTITAWKALDEFTISESPDQPEPEPEPAQAEF